MKKQKTAVDFYDQQLHILDLRLKSGSITIGEYFTLKSELYTQAKQMEKEQIIDSFMQGADIGDMFNNENRAFITDAEQYYESKYGKDETQGN